MRWLLECYNYQGFSSFPNTMMAFVIEKNYSVHMELLCHGATTFGTEVNSTQWMWYYSLYSYYFLLSINNIILAVQIAKHPPGNSLRGTIETSPISALCWSAGPWSMHLWAYQHCFVLWSGESVFSDWHHCCWSIFLYFQPFRAVHHAVIFEISSLRVGLVITPGQLP